MNGEQLMNIDGHPTDGIGLPRPLPDSGMQ
jgi:hypothetical protein